MPQLQKSKKFTGVMHSALKNGDKSYYITYKINGKVTRIHIGKRSEAFCHQKRNEAINSAKFGLGSSIVKTKKESKLFSDLATNYFKYSEVHNKDYYNQLKRYDKHLKPYCDQLTIDEITPSFVETIQQEKKKILSPKSVNHLTQMISTIINHAITRKTITIENPLKIIKKLPVDNARTRYLSIYEINQLLNIIKTDEQLYLFTKLALSTGGRLYTLVNIMKKNINFDTKIIELTDFKNGTTYNGFIDDELIEILKERTKCLNANDYILLFNTAKSNLDDLISKRIKPILDQLFNQGLNTRDTKNRVVTHSLRHTFASHLAINGTPIFTIQKLMNHKDINMTMRYAKLAPDSGRDFVNNLYK